MGVAGLRLFLESLKIPRPVNLAQLASLHRTSVASTVSSPSAPPELLEIAVDGPALTRRLYSAQLDWICGGQWEFLFKNRVRSFVDAFTRQGFRLTVFFDGKITDAKRKTWIARRLGEQKKVVKTLDALSAAVESGRPLKMARSAALMPMSTTRVVADAFAACGCKVVVSFGECDRELAHYAMTNHSFAVLADDSDFSVWNLERVLWVTDLDTKVTRTVMVERETKERLLGLNGEQIAWLATLAGNDYINTVSLSRLHRHIIKTHHPTPIFTDALPSLPPSHLIFPSLVAFLRVTPIATLPSILASLLTPNLLSAVRTAHAEYTFASMETGGDREQGTDAMPASLLAPFPDGLRAGLDPENKQVAFRAPMDLVRHYFMSGRFDHELMSVLRSRTMNVGVVIEVAGRWSGWQVVQGSVMRRIYGVLLGNGQGGLDDMVGTQRDAMMPVLSAVRQDDSAAAAVAGIETNGSMASLGKNDTHPMLPNGSFDTSGDILMDDFNELDDGITRGISKAVGVEDDAGSETSSEDDVEDESATDDDDTADADIDATPINFVPPENPGQIVEWVGVHAREPTISTPLFRSVDNIPLPSLARILCAPLPVRSAAFLTVMGVPQSGPVRAGFARLARAYPPTLTAVACAVHLLCADLRLGDAMSTHVVTALVATAVDQALKPASYAGHGTSAARGRAGTPATPLGLHVAAAFQRCMFAARLANDATGRPLGTVRAWEYFDGVRFQTTLAELKRGGPIPELGWRAKAFRDVVEVATLGTPLAVEPRRAHAAGAQGRGGRSVHEQAPMQGEENTRRKGRGAGPGRPNSAGPYGDPRGETRPGRGSERGGQRVGRGGVRGGGRGSQPGDQRQGGSAASKGRPRGQHAESALQ
ncbi:hypothetical protein M427DRAFT_72915 [Gonapodya prolifera JEL478]|uniref:Uncharacterized protein n=1 Tax=Gonapodya prolifera (strain JEL478) TaxID=1344416 RepID=A0A139A4N0_GONPJ|nr:hypothetical protein M427DRAFT_72915 [Gonapodya prolifera JEL478]|eukprot:KXS11455.1 hypothetical protein M427DRAFT_72915 [Gonapodya prolifera JEL478]